MMNKNKEIKRLSKFAVATVLAIGSNTLIIANAKADNSNGTTALNQLSGQMTTSSKAMSSTLVSSSSVSEVGQTNNAAEASNVNSSQSPTSQTASASFQKTTASKTRSLTNEPTNESTNTSQNADSESQDADANNQVETNHVSQSVSKTQKVKIDSDRYIAAAQSETAANETEVANDQKSVDTIKSQIDGLNQEINNESDADNHNLITVSSDYANALNSYIDSVVNDNSSSDESLVKLATEGLSANSYQNNVADEKTSAIPGNLSDSQIEELSNYAASLINYIRQQLGTTPSVSVVKGAVSFAKAVADNYSSDDWNIYIYKDHDDSAINQAALTNGLATYDGSNAYEDASAGYLISNVDGQRLTNYFTLNDYKRAIYNTLTAMLFDDADENWFHAMSITNLNDYAGTDNYGSEKATQYFAVSVDDLGQIHFEFIPEWQILALSKFDTSNNLLKLKDQLAASKIALATAKNALTIAQSKLDTVEKIVKLRQKPKTVSEKICKDNRIEQLLVNRRNDSIQIHNRHRVASMINDSISKLNKGKASTAKFINYRISKQPLNNESREFSASLPQTDENDNSVLASIGFLMIEMTGLVGIVGKLRKQ